MENKEELSMYAPIENSPFSMVKKDDGKIKVVMGRAILTDREFETEEEVFDWLEVERWEVTLCMILAVQATIEDLQKQIKKQKV